MVRCSSVRLRQLLIVRLRQLRIVGLRGALFLWFSVQVSCCRRGLILHPVQPVGQRIHICFGKASFSLV